MKILVIAAHPDDEILGIGGTLLKHESRGDEIFICIATSGYEPQWSSKEIGTRKLEQISVDKLLKTKKRYNLGLPTVKLNMLPHGEFNQKISEVISEVNPDIIYTHFEGDLNYDHSLIFKACLVATRPPKRIKLLCFETLSETEWGNKPFFPNTWIDITEFIEEKEKMFSIYESEVKAYPHPRSLKGIKFLAQKRGSEICVNYAEAFLLVREIIK